MAKSQRTSTPVELIERFSSLIEKFLAQEKQVESFLRWEGDNPSPGHIADCATRCEVEWKKTRDELHRTGKALAAALEANGCKSKAVFKVLYFAECNRIPSGVWDVWPEVKPKLEQLKLRLLSGSNGRAKILPERRTRPMALRVAAKLMGYGKSRDAAERLRAAIKADAVACESHTRQQHVFDRNDFPATVHDQI